MDKSRFIKSKIKKTIPLMKDPLISRYIPETCKFNLTNLEIMINKYRCVYIKPNNGSLGKGIFRLKALDNKTCELIFGKNMYILPYNKIIKILQQNLNKEKIYVIQQGIDLSTLNNCPFDIRIVLQKVLNRWQLSLIYGKVAIDENAIVTNIAQGNRRVTLETALIENDQNWNGLLISRHLIDVAHQIAHILGDKFPVNILGLDMAIDKEGKIWFIEANSRPQIKNIEEINDKLSIQKYYEAKNMISLV